MTVTTRRIVRGCTMDDQGFINDCAPREMAVNVDADGRAWPVAPCDIAPNAKELRYYEPLSAERWGDDDWLGRNFSPNAGEFERCGIKFTLRGSAKERA